MKLSLTRITAQEALALWELSPHASAFTHPQVLQLLADEVHWWLCNNHDEPVCLWPVCLDQNNTVTVPGASYYVGPMWVKTNARIPVHRRLSTDLAVYESFIPHFIESYGAVRAVLPIGLQDVRAFDWWNYGETGKPRFAIRPRYTARIDTLQSRSMTEIMAGFRQVRRYEIKQLEKSALPTPCNDWSVDELSALYAQIFHGKGEEPGSRARQTMQRILSAVEAGFGEVFACRYEPREELAYAGVVLYGKASANLVYSMVSGKHRNSGLAAWAIRNQIRTAQERGMEFFDFNGANSPSRGDDKHSYGAEAALFFEIELSSKGE